MARMIRSLNDPKLIQKVDDFGAPNKQRTLNDAFDYPYFVHQTVDGLTNKPAENISPPTNWHTDNPTGKIKVVSGIKDSVLKQSKEAFALSNHKAYQTNLYTTISTETNTLIKITFDVSQLSQASFASIQDLDIFIDGKKVKTEKTYDLSNFYTQTVKAPGTGQPMRIEFKVAKQANDEILLDNIHIEPVFLNQPPIASNDSANAFTNQPLTIDFQKLFANDSDPDHDTIYAFSVQNATNGTASIVDQSVVFNPQKDYVGPASFSYTITDGKGGFSEAKVTVSVEAKPEAQQHQSLIIHDKSVNYQSTFDACENLCNDPLLATVLLAALVRLI